LSDEVRDNDLIQLGIRFEDKGSKGFEWKYENKETLLKEMA